MYEFLQVSATHKTLKSSRNKCNFSCNLRECCAIVLDRRIFTMTSKIMLLWIIIVTTCRFLYFFNYVFITLILNTRQNFFKRYSSAYGLHLTPQQHAARIKMWSKCSSKYSSFSLKLWTLDYKIRCTNLFFIKKKI